MSDAKYIFWSYDQFPYVLGGATKGEPRVYNEPSGVRAAYDVPSYGRSFYAGYVTSVKIGCDVDAQLDDLRAEYKQAQAKLLVEYKQKALAIAPFLSTFPAYKD